MADPITPDTDSAESGEHSLEGWVAPLGSEAEIRGAVEKVFDYRGDVTLSLKDGRTIDGYVFDRRKNATALSDCVLRVMPADGSPIVTLRYSDLAAIAFTGRDTAAGKSFETWVKKYRENRA